MKILIAKERQKIYPDKLEQDINTNERIIRKKDYNSRKEIITTHKGIKILKINPDFHDLFNNMKRGPQIIRPEDSALIIFLLGVMEGYNVLDCGGGSGAMTCAFANTAGQKGSVVSVEKEKKFAGIVKENTERFGFRNVKIVNSKLEDYKPRIKFDAVNIDLPNPWEAIIFIEKYLKNGKRFTVYVPNTTQLTRMSREAENTELVLESVHELIHREWEVDKRICHPKFKILGHTGFIMLYRKMKGV
ncbi:hypothetical protein COZ55_00940 [archaeon CG_4_8_14_3_um_filter_38_5]|nr:MAG: hypothetical protein COZ55_00940 [archaeon CG_4_8_14_3_um_filter_38_5]